MMYNKVGYLHICSDGVDAEEEDLNLMLRREDVLMFLKDALLIRCKNWGRGAAGNDTAWPNTDTHIFVFLVQMLRDYFS